MCAVGTTQAKRIVALTLKINTATHECYLKSLLACMPKRAGDMWFVLV